MTPLIMRHDIWEIQLADEVVRSLGRYRQRFELLLGLLLLLLREISRVLSFWCRHFMNRIGGDGGLCFEVSFFS